MSLRPAVRPRPAGLRASRDHRDDPGPARRRM